MLHCGSAVPIVAHHVLRTSNCLHRCLFTLESAFHPLFTPWEGNCRLPYSIVANRCVRASAVVAACAACTLTPSFLAHSGLYTALFRHMQTVGRAGCVHTAFELAKLMLHLDPAVDPRRVLLCIGEAPPPLAARGTAWQFV